MSNNNEAIKEKLYNIIDEMASNGDIEDALEIHAIYNKLKKCYDNLTEKIGDNKYEITDISEYRFEREVYRIRALKNFSDVKKGDLGGFVSSYDNLSQHGDCWIYDNAAVVDEANIIEDAKIKDNAKICGVSVVRGDSVIRDDCEIYMQSFIVDSYMSGNCCLYNAEVHDSKLEGYLHINQSSIQKSNIIANDAIIHDKTFIHDSKLKLTKGSDICKSYVAGSIIQGCIRLDNVELTNSKVIDKDEEVCVNNKIIDSAHIINSDNITSVSLGSSDKQEEYGIVFYKNRKGNTTITMSHKSGVHESIEI